MLFFTSTLASVAIVYVCKYVFNISRPENGIIFEESASFPSAHAAAAAAFFVALMYVFDRYLSSIPRIVFNIFCISCIFIVAVSRVYLGVHWASDVVAGIAAGALVSYGVIRILKRVV
jgi:undecaprenyl-diphosphatase